MLKMFRCGWLLPVSLFILYTASGCTSPQTPARRLISPKLLKAAKLEVLWQNELPMEKSKKVKRFFIFSTCLTPAENLDKLIILGERIYVFSDRNYMLSLNRQKGNVIFSRPITTPGLPVVGFDLYKNQLLSVVANNLVEMDAEFGTELSTRRLDFNVVCPAARNSLFFYIADTDGRIHAIRAEDRVEFFQVSAKDEPTITSIIADDSFVVFTTEAGDCISMMPDRGQRRWQFNANAGIVGPAVRYQDALFIASKDTNIYRINISTGKLIWKYQTGAALNKSPRVTQGVVYQYVHNKGLAAIDKENGRLLWFLPEGIELLAEAGEKAYIITNARTWAVMDNKNAKQLYSVNFAGVSRYAVNVVDSKIYIADQAGRIACLIPVK